MGVRDGPFHPIQKKYPLVSSSQLNLVVKKWSSPIWDEHQKNVWNPPSWGWKMVNYYRLPIWNQLFDAAKTPKLQSMPFEGLKSDCQVPGKNATTAAAFRRDVYGGYKSKTPFKWKINQDISRLSREIIRWKCLKIRLTATNQPVTFWWFEARYIWAPHGCFQPQGPLLTGEALRAGLTNRTIAGSTTGCHQLSNTRPCIHYHQHTYYG